MSHTLNIIKTSRYTYRFNTEYHGRDRKCLYVNFLIVSRYNQLISMILKNQDKRIHESNKTVHNLK